MWNLKYDTNELIYETRNRLTDIQNSLMVAKEDGRGQGYSGNLRLAGVN